MVDVSLRLLLCSQTKTHFAAREITSPIGGRHPACGALDSERAYRLVDNPPSRVRPLTLETSDSSRSNVLEDRTSLSHRSFLVLKHSPGLRGVERLGRLYLAIHLESAQSHGHHNSHENLQRTTNTLTIFRGGGHNKGPRSRREPSRKLSCRHPRSSRTGEGNIVDRVPLFPPRRSPYRVRTYRTTRRSSRGSHKPLYSLMPSSTRLPYLTPIPPFH